MQTLGDMAKSLNRSAVYLAGLQRRFELPTFQGAAYSPAYAAFLRGVVALRTFDISEETLRELWNVEKKLLQLLHVDSTGSRTWFLDSCGATRHRKRRLLLSNHNLGVALTGRAVQTGLNFASSLPELFAGKDMGEDALRVLRACLTIHARIRDDIASELPHIRVAIEWARIRSLLEIHL
jgi:hypothetical protein